MYLNASHNKIEHVSDFTPPWYLTYVNLSYNYITDIGDLSSCWSIVRLNLSHNILESISGLKNLKHLQYLNLSYNLIERIENLDDLNIRELNLEGNYITSFRSAIPGRGINTLSNLRIILLGHNRLSTLSFFKVIITKERIARQSISSPVLIKWFLGCIHLTLRRSKVQ
ncbi:LRGUK protein, partial [Acromyrmex heyeri]